ncbi:hypothetical protein QJQ45_012421 [Haematococcus lacustris]|nr:hypothetical protein QJQ45_012421 [Haematococcus lacustris]
MVTTLERQTGGRLKALRSDRGGEYVGGELQRWLSSEGILHQQTAPYSPEMNGSAERVNRTVMNSVRAMLDSSGAPKPLWGEAARAVATVHNVSPVAGLPHTPWEVAFGHVPDVSFLRVWGAPAYIHQPDQLRRKLDSKVAKGIFVGYELGCRSYRVLVEGRVRISKTVVVDEAAVLRRSAPAAVEEESEQQAAPAVAAPTTVSPASGGTAGAAKGHTGAGTADRVAGMGAVPASNPAASSPAADPVAGKGAGSPAPAAPRGGEPVTSSYSLRPRIKPPVRFRDTVSLCLLASGGSGSSGGSGGSGGSLAADPQSYQEAMARPDADDWLRAMNKEMACQAANQTWELVQREGWMRVLPGRWVLKIKRVADGNIGKYKARFVIKGFRQVEGVDFDDSYAPVVLHSTQRIVLSVAAARGWELQQLDVETAFLNAPVDEGRQVFCEQPPGFEAGQGLVCQLQKAVYGLRQAPRAWYQHLAQQLQQLNFSPSAADPCLFSLDSPGPEVHLLVYVDDIILASPDAAAITAVKEQLRQVFSLHDLGPVASFLGMRIMRDQAAGTLRLDQQQYVEQLLQRFGLAEANGRQLPLSPGTRLVKEGTALDSAATLQYRQMVGALLYASTCTRPDIAFAVGQLSRFMQQPTLQHHQAATGLLRYLKRTAAWGLVYSSSGSSQLQGYADADYAGDPDSMRSTSGTIFVLNGAAVSWRSQLQTTVAASTTEAETQAAAAATKEALFLRKVLHHLGASCDPIPIFCDNQGAVALIKNPVESSRSRHIAVAHHLARERQARGEVVFTHCPSTEMVADALTKPLSAQLLHGCVRGMGVS